MDLLLRKSQTGLETVEGEIYSGFGIYKEKINNQYYCILLDGNNKGVAICSCSKLSLLKEFIDKVQDIAKSEEFNNDYVDTERMIKINRLRNEYWIL